MPCSELTTVSVSWRQKKRNHRLIFGCPAKWVRLDWRRRLAVFEAGQIFGYERWQRGPFGTKDWQVYVIRAGRVGEQISSIDGVRPGGGILFAALGKDRAKRALNTLSALSEKGSLSSISADYWRVLSLKIDAGQSQNIALQAS